ncbi:MAG: hypothetical protein GY895_12050 [Phycisphaera sp.]|nr:hypothetical protein [Phycisphaera sp.]
MFPSILIILLLSAPVDPPEPTTNVGDGQTPACCEPGAARASAILAAAMQSAPADARSPEVETVLDLIDRQSAGLKTYRGRVSMENYDDLADESERRFGRVWLVSPADGDPTGRQAAVVFERLVESNGRMRERTEHWVYRDGVLSDYDHEAKRLVRRRIADPGDKRDPLRLGEGPIPIPIGQRKTDIVAAFDVTKASAVPARLAGKPDGVVGIRLVPKSGTKLATDGDMVSIDYWVRAIDGEPVAIEVIEKDRDRVAIRFFESTFNAGIDEEARRWLVAPDVDAKTWRIEDR